MTVKLMVLYPLKVPDEVIDDMEQELYTSLMGYEEGNIKVGMFINYENYPSLKKHLETFGVNKDVKIYVEAELDA